MHDTFVTVHTSGDSTEAGMIAALLEDHGLTVKVVSSGVTAVLGTSIGEARVAVPEDTADEARTLIEAYLAAPAEGMDEPERAEEDEPEAQEPTRLRPLVGAGVAFILPGAAHLYARRTAAGLAIFTVQIVALFGMLQADRSLAMLATVVAAGMLAFDVFGGVRAARAANRGVVRSTGRQLGTTGAALAALTLVGFLSADTLAHFAFHARRAGAVDPSTPQSPLRPEADTLRRTVEGADQLPFPLHLDFNH